MSELKQNLLNYIKQNPIKLFSSLSYFFGGLLLLIYFLHIEYFPTNMKLEDLLLISLLSCVTGILLIMIIIVTLIFPVINYQSCKKLSLFEKRIKDKYIQSYKVKPKSKNCISLVFASCLKPLPMKEIFNPQFQLLLLPLSIFVGSFAYLILSTNFNTKSQFLIALFVAITVAFLVFYKNFKSTLPNLGLFAMLKFEIFYIYIKKIIFSFMMMFFSFVISFPIMLNSPILKNDKFSLVAFTILFMMSFIFINIIERNFFKRIIINILILFTLLFITNTLHVIPSIILKEFNIAQVKVDKISIDGKGCKIINPDSNSSECIEKNIRLVWKLGGMYVFDKPLDSNFTTFERYEIPQEFILSRQQVLKISN